MINATFSRYAQMTHVRNVEVKEAELKNKLKKSVESESEKE